MVFPHNSIHVDLDPTWDVREVITADFNNDGEDEIAVSLWKKGNFGKSLPFWVEENDDSYKMHLFLYDQDFNPVWQSSNLPKINLRTRFYKNKLLVLEQSYDNPYDISLSTWKWSGWGFEHVEELFSII